MEHDADKWNITRRVTRISVIIFTLFAVIALITWRLTGLSFMIFNFLYIGSAVAIGIFMSSSLPRKHILWGRRITQLLVGIYLLFIVGIFFNENMQIEAFFASILTGILLGGAFIHIMIAETAGPVVFNRGWCGWACWTVMILDLLPWKRPENGRIPYLGGIRYIHFFVSLIIVYIFLFPLSGNSIIGSTLTALQWFIIGNILYYFLGISLAAILKDNRAFCKYICPLTVLLKVFSRFSIMKMEICDKCDECGACEKFCPMDIKLLDYKNANQRILSTECILCTTCIHSCPQSAIDCTIKFDLGGKEYLNYKK